MKLAKIFFLAVLSSALLFSGCKSMSRTQKGAVIGTAAGGAAGAVIGRASGNTAVGAVVGAAVGGVAGALIGKQMDKQAEEIQKEIPGVIVERVGEGIVVEFTNNILFGFDKSNLTADAMESLDKLVIILNKYPDTDIEIHGHTDSKGTNSYNQSLSERRSAAVANYLLNKKIAAQRLTTIGFGEEMPKYSNETEAGRAQNRRVEFAITANEKMKLEAEKEAERQGN
jgi:outer membrane protein OmpA-like peptidoglycan-associated protein